KKCDREMVRIIISFNNDLFDDENAQIYAANVEKLSKCLKYYKGEDSYLKIGNVKEGEYKKFSLKKFKKQRQEILPSRVPMKRKHFV
uniref:Uncharacterized protein n=1 Tax=Panagrolaimus sp. ES5 TaxID=591445 RepID=A0AC34FIW8_9BILA